MIERFDFSDLRELFAKANEEKSGDQLAGIAARSERERVAAKRKLADLTLGEIVRRPLIDGSTIDVSTINVSTISSSGDEVTRGWQKVLDRYKEKYSDRAKMGTLTFSNLEITSLSNDSAIALGSWSLKRMNDQPHGRFTLIFRRFHEGWKIIHDHTSAAEK